jgi:outer membrane protein assembly factor BamB
MRTCILFLPIFLLLAYRQSVAQSPKTVVYLNKKAVGKKWADQTDIMAQEYTFPERIEGMYVDSAAGLLTMQLRGLSANGRWLNNNGSIVMFDINQYDVKWTKKMAYQASTLQQFGPLLIHTTGDRSFCLDQQSGEPKWEVKNNIYHVDPKAQVGIGYQFRGRMTGYTNTLEGIDLNTGQVIWQREIDRSYGWNQVGKMNDSTLLIVSGGLHTVNLRTGAGWDYQTPTGKKDYSGIVAANAAGVALGLLTGTFILSTGSSLVRDIASNSTLPHGNSLSGSIRPAAISSGLSAFWRSRAASHCCGSMGARCT